MINITQFYDERIITLTKDGTRPQDDTRLPAPREEDRLPNRSRSSRRGNLLFPGREYPVRYRLWFQIPNAARSVLPSARVVQFGNSRSGTRVVGIS
jgi:hypothetical protein